MDDPLCSQQCSPLVRAPHTAGKMWWRSQILGIETDGKGFFEFVCLVTYMAPHRTL
jgi:hypothetical protein